jgi:hypothetical protein
MGLKHFPRDSTRTDQSDMSLAAIESFRKQGCHMTITPELTQQCRGMP